MSWRRKTGAGAGAVSGCTRGGDRVVAPMLVLGAGAGVGRCAGGGCRMPVLVL